MKPAFAEELDVYVQADAAQARVEESAAAYEEAMQSLEKIEEEIAENEMRLTQLAEKLLERVAGKPMLLCLEADCAQALGQRIALLAGKDAGILCIDRVRLPRGSYLDVGAPVGPAFPVVVKTLIFNG